MVKRASSVCFTQMEIKLLIYSKDRVYKLLCIKLLENHRRNHAEIKFVEVLFGIYSLATELSLVRCYGGHIGLLNAATEKYSFQ